MALNVEAYLAANPDVAAAVARGEMTAEQHYNLYGQYEGRDPGGANSGAQTNFWDNQNWQTANPGGTRASGIQPANFNVNLNGLPNTTYYQLPYQWEGQTYGGRLDAVQMKQLQDRVAAGEDYNTVAMRLLGDGIGTGARENEKGMVAQDYDVGAGSWVTGGTAGGTLYNVQNGQITGATRNNNATNRAGTSQGGMGGGGDPLLRIRGPQSGGLQPNVPRTGGVMPPPYGTDGIDSNWFNTQPGNGNGFLNPFQPQMFGAVTQQVTENLNRNVLPGLRSAATATGGFGGSRQGVVEANALKDANQQLSNTLGNIQYTDWNNYQNRLLQNKGLDNSYNLGLGQLDLGYLNANNSFYTAQRGQDLQQLGLGASIFGNGVQGIQGGNQGIYNLGLNQQQAQWQPLTGFANVSGPYTGFGSTTGTGSSNNQLGNIMGGGLMGAQFMNTWRGNAGMPAYNGNNIY